MSSLFRNLRRDGEAGQGLPDIRSIADPTLRRATLEPDHPAQLVSPGEARIAALTEEVAALKLALQAAREEAREQADAGREEGRKAAEAAFRRDETTHLAVLEAALSAAAGQLADSFDRAERAGLALARAALGRVIGPGAPRQQLLEEIIHHQIETLRGQSILSVRMSAQDLAGEGMARAEALFAGRGIEVRADPQLAPGDCRMILRLGERDVGPDVQWSALAALFAELAGE